MIDFFLLFDLPRRPLIDLDKLNEAFAQKNAGNQLGKPSDPVVLNEAFRVLTGTGSRLDHLLALESANLRDRAIGPELEQWFGRVARVLHRFDEIYYQLAQESLHLLRAAKLQLLQENLEEAEEISRGLNSLRESLMRELQEIDDGWPKNRPEALPHLAQLALNLTFTEKWLNELKERKLRFDELA
ncbi:MAG TPA: hypothetical protein VE242_14625 [Chthoniobacterales bacterium]|nr:hypothetical protein [Chthoniobacterales bacterium]